MSDGPAALLVNSAGTEIATSANPVRTDPTGTTAQPVTGTFWQGTQPVSGPLTDTQLRATAVPVSGTFWQATQPVSIATMPTTPVTGTFWQATQPVSGPLTDTQLRATAVPVSGTFWQATQPVSAASLPLPTGASTSALQTTGNTSLGNIDTKTPALGQATMAASTPVVIASNQSAVPISAASLPLPTGAATETTLAAVSGKLPATLGQKAMAASLAVVFASDQSTLPVSMAGGGYGGQVEGRAADGVTPVGNPVLMGGSDGTNAQTLLTDSLGRLVTAPAGAGVTTAGFALGTMVTTAVTDVPIRATTYTEQASNAQRSVSSASANDASAGTGARQVKITYYDSTGAGPSTETVTMNGTTPVNTVSTTICYIEKIEVVSVGSTGSNVGIITLFAATAGGGGAVGTIAATANRTFWAHHYTPTGKTTYITSVAGNNTSTANVTVVSIRAKALTATAPDVVVSDYVAIGGPTAQEARNFGTAIQVAGPSRIVLYGAPAGTPSITTRASFDYYDQ